MADDKVMREVADHLKSIKDIQIEQSRKQDVSDLRDKIESASQPNIRKRGVKLESPSFLLDQMKSSIVEMSSTFTQPGGLMKLMGLATGSPLLMLVGDKVEELTDQYKENKKERMSYEDKLKVSLKDLKISSDQRNNIMEGLETLTSEDNREIQKLLVSNGVTNSESMDELISNMKSFEEGLLFSNPEMEDMLEEQGKSSKEIIMTLRGMSEEIEKGNEPDFEQERKDDIIEKLTIDQNALLERQANALEELGIEKKDDGDGLLGGLGKGKGGLMLSILKYLGTGALVAGAGFAGFKLGEWIAGKIDEKIGPGGLGGLIFDMIEGPDGLIQSMKNIAGKVVALMATPFDIIRSFFTGDDENSLNGMLDKFIKTISFDYVNLDSIKSKIDGMKNAILKPAQDILSFFGFGDKEIEVSPNGNKTLASDIVKNASIASKMKKDKPEQNAGTGNRTQINQNNIQSINDNDMSVHSDDLTFKRLVGVN